MRYIIMVIFFIDMLLCTDSRLQFFKMPDQPHFEEVSTDVSALQQIAHNTLSFIKKYEHKDWFVPVKTGLLEQKDITFEDVKKTLSYIIEVIDHDKGKSKQRMLDSNFLSTHFTFIRWLPDLDTAHKRDVYPKAGKLRITKYLIYHVQGSYVKTNNFPYALYALQEKDQNLLKKYTKQDVLAGVFDAEKKAHPLVWLSRDDLEEALMQGTIYVTMPDNKIRIFNVAYNNGIAYDQKLKNKKEQKRYWSFREINENLGFGPDASHKVTIVPEVTFAGDVHLLGFGKIIALQYYDSYKNKNMVRLGVLADTGGAFEDNLYQLDFFAGIFLSKEIFNQETKSVPTLAQAYIVVKK